MDPKQAEDYSADTADEILISELQKYGVLYDKSHRDYKDRLVVANAWSAVAKATKSKVDYCQKRWLAMRTKFTRERKKCKSPASGAAAAERTESTWPLFQLMQFLSPYIKHRKRISNFCNSQDEMSENSDVEDGQEIEQTADGDAIQDNNGAQNTDETTEKTIDTAAGAIDTAVSTVDPVAGAGVHVSSPPCPPTPSTRKRKPKTTDAKQPDAGREIVSLLKQEIGKVETEEELFGMMISKKLQKMDPIVKTKAMIGMQQVLLNCMTQEASASADRPLKLNHTMPVPPVHPVSLYAPSYHQPPAAVATHQTMDTFSAVDGGLSRVNMLQL